MRKLIITLAAAGAAVAIAAPASAQVYGQPYYPQQPGYGQQYGAPYDYGQQNGYGQQYGAPHAYGQIGQAQRLQMRIDMLQNHIRRLDRADRIGNRAAKSLKREARAIEMRLRGVSAYGLNPYEARDIEVRLARLEQRVSYSMNQRFGRNWRTFNYGQAGQYGQYGYGYGHQGQHAHDRDDDDRGDWDRDDD